MIGRLLDLEKELRLSEEFHDSCLITGSLRNMNCCRDELWFALMESEGFLVDGKFLAIVDIIFKTKDMTETKRVFTLEAVGCDLSLIAKDFT